MNQRYYNNRLYSNKGLQNNNMQQNKTQSTLLIINMSFSQGVFQDVLKLARVIPLLKTGTNKIFITIDQFQ